MSKKILLCHEEEFLKDVIYLTETNKDIEWAKHFQELGKSWELKYNNAILIIEILSVNGELNKYGKQKLSEDLRLNPHIRIYLNNYCIIDLIPIKELGFSDKRLICKLLSKIYDHFNHRVSEGRFKDQFKEEVKSFYGC